MLDKNDLEAIAQLMDSKLTPINGRLDRMETRLDRMEGRLDRMETRLDCMETRLDQMQEDIESLKEDSAITETGSIHCWNGRKKHRCRCRFHFSKKLNSLYT